MSSPHFRPPEVILPRGSRMGTILRLASAKPGAAVLPKSHPSDELADRRVERCSFSPRNRLGHSDHTDDCYTLVLPYELAIESLNSLNSGLFSDATAFNLLQYEYSRPYAFHSPAASGFPASGKTRSALLKNQSFLGLFFKMPDSIGQTAHHALDS